MGSDDIDFVIVERLIKAESERKKTLLKRKSTNLLWFILVGLTIVFMSL